jgi:uncharacterized protein YpmB
MSNNAKAGLIIGGILIAVIAMVFLILYGVGREDLKTEIPLPSDAAAKTYVLEHKLLAEVNRMEIIRPGGPNFKAIEGKDEAGLDKLVWLTGKDKKIVERGSVLVKDGLTKLDMLAKLAKEKNITQAQIEAMFVTPYDYKSGRIVWFVREKDIRGHILSYDFKTGELLFEIYQDPTAWKM